MNIVISDPKTRKAYAVNTEKPVFIGKKLGEEVELSAINLKGYKGILTGGSDKDGFPMRKDLDSTSRRKLFLAKGPGYKAKEKGARKRKRVRGKIIAEDIHQLNLKITAQGEKGLEELLGKKEEKTEENKKENENEKKD